jgi:uncharacterized damage-inducible protein DinB
MSPELARFHRMFEHDTWANATVLDALRAGPAPDQARAWIAHIIAAERLWLARLRQEPPTMPVWPDLDLDECAAELAGLQGDWTRWLETLDQDGLGDGVAYRNSKGEFWTSIVGDVLTHVLLHGSYHRGQIASAVRAAGGEPAYTDFIHAVRSGLIE